MGRNQNMTAFGLAYGFFICCKKFIFKSFVKLWLENVLGCWFVRSFWYFNWSWLFTVNSVAWSWARAMFKSDQNYIWKWIKAQLENWMYFARMSGDWMQLENGILLGTKWWKPIVTLYASKKLILTKRVSGKFFHLISMIFYWKKST